MKKEKSNYLLSVESKLQRVLSEIFVDSSFNFMGKNIFVNVLYVNLSTDLSIAKVALNTFGLDNPKDVQKLVDELNKNFIRQVRNLICQKMNMKIIPNIVFLYDNREERAIKINKIIDKEMKKIEKE